jgi:hypothetical protein
VSIRDASAKTLLSALTDSKGRFVFRNLPPSAGYILGADKVGYWLTNFTEMLPISPVLRVRVDAGQWIPDVNLTLLRFGGIAGTVTDERGEPVVNIDVRVLKGIAIGGAYRWVAGPVARTDDRGMYRIAGLRGGSYLVHVPSPQSTVPTSSSVATVRGVTPEFAATHPVKPETVTGVDVAGTWLVVGRGAVPPAVGGARRTYPARFYPNTRSPEGAVPIELTDGEERRGVDVALQPVPVFQVSGQAIGPPEALKGLVVRLFARATESLGQGCVQATALVNADGTFVLVDVPAGAYTLDASTKYSELVMWGESNTGPTPGWVSVGADLTTLGGLEASVRRFATVANQDFIGSAQVNVGEDNLANVVVSLRPAAVLTGHVLGVKPQDLPRTFVSVEPANGDPTLGKLTPAERPPSLGTNGAFTIRGLREGAYSLRVSGSGVVRSIVAGGQDYTFKPIVVVAGVDPPSVVVTMADNPATLAGAVRDRQGALVREAAVLVFPRDPEQWAASGFGLPTIRSVAYFGEAGYQVRPLPAGEYYVVAIDMRQREAWRDARFLAAAASVATPVTLAWGQAATQDLVLQRVVLK